jgi:autotransporter-associated beta strand protein
MPGTGEVSLFGGGTGGTGRTGAQGTGGGGGGAGMGGALFVIDGSTATITSSATFTGNSLQAGTGGAVVLGGTAGTNGQTFGTDIFLMSGGTLVFDLSSNLNLANIIESDQLAVGGAGGGLTKQGAATLTLNGAQTYTGTTTVSAGTLALNGSVITNTVVNGGRFQGNASILSFMGAKNLTVNGGTVAPGNSIGTINVSGNYTQGAGGTLEIEITPAGLTDLLNITGTASLNGTLLVMPSAGSYTIGTTYTFLQSTGGVSGTFSTFTVQNGVVLGINYLANSVQLVVRENIIIIPFPATSSNARHVQTCLMAGSTNGNQDLTNVLNLIAALPTTSEFNAALNQLQPARFNAIDISNLNVKSEVQKILAKHLFELNCATRACGSKNAEHQTPPHTSSKENHVAQSSSPKTNASNNSSAHNSIWIEPFGQFVEMSQIQQLTGFDTTTGGVVGGYDYCTPAKVYLGAAFGYANSHLEWHQQNGHGQIQNFFGGFYGSFKGDYLWFDASALTGVNEYKLRRNISFTGLHRKAKSDHWGWDADLHVGFTGNHQLKYLRIQPFAEAEYYFLYQERFNERGAQSLSLDIRKKNSQMMRSQAGVRVSDYFEIDYGCWSPYVAFSYVGKYSLGSTHEKASFDDESCVFSAKGFDRILNAFSPEIGINLTLNNGLELFGSYSAEVGPYQKTQQVDLRLQWNY